MDVEDSALVLDICGNYLHPLKKNHVELTWTNLNYSVTEKSWQLAFNPIREVIKPILRNISGKIESETVTAVVGPSGAGKSSLLELLAGRRRVGLTGDITIEVPNKKDAHKVGIAFMGQKDIFADLLTVRETLLFASKLKNYAEEESLKSEATPLPTDGEVRVVSFEKHNKAANFHADLVDSIIDELNLSRCAQTRVGNCSGGQQKRLSIACELVSQPSLLILDEPTSGLDSASAFQCVQLLRKLAKNKSLAVIASIHQPSSQTLNLFDNIYAISHEGQCIYNGKTGQLLSALSASNLECPMFYNPADFLIEIASGEQGKKAIEDLVKVAEEQVEEESNSHGLKLHKVIDKIRKTPLPLFRHTGILFMRTMVVTCREPVLASLSLFQHLFVALAMGFLYSTRVGMSSGCYTAKQMEPGALSFDALQEFQREESLTTENIGFLFFSTIFLFLASMMMTVLTFPLEMNVFMKETSNRWYSAGSYYWARTFADTPFRIVFPVVYSVIVYQMTGQIGDHARFMGFILLNVLVAFIAQSKGLLIGAIYANKVEGAVFFAPLSMILPLLFGGFFVNVSNMPSYLKPLPFLSYYKYAFDGLLSLIYGFGRCSAITLQAGAENITHNPFFSLHESLKKVNISFTEVTPLVEFFLESKNVNGTLIEEVVDRMNQVEKEATLLFESTSTLGIDSPSYVLSHFKLSDDDFIDNMMALLSFFIVFRLAAYLVLAYRANSSRK